MQGKAPYKTATGDTKPSMQEALKSQGWGLPGRKKADSPKNDGKNGGKAAAGGPGGKGAGKGAGKGGGKGGKGAAAAASVLEDEDLENGGFIAAAIWLGPKAHMVFRSGALGQGYYCDVRGGATLDDLDVVRSEEAGMAPAPTGGAAEPSEPSEPGSPVDLEWTNYKQEGAAAKPAQEGGWLSWFGIAA